MDMSMIVILAVVAGAVMFMANKDDSESTKEDKPIEQGKGKYKSKAIMTSNEIEFFNRLVQALPEYYVFPQVSMGAILQGASDDYKENGKIRLTFAQKIVDYVIYTKELKPVAIIELDDKTHTQEKDEKRDEMTKQAGYKTIRFQSKNKPSVEQIRELIKI